MKGNNLSRHLRILLLSGLILGVTCSSAFAQDQTGTRGFPFLRIGVDARALGLGDAYTSIAQGPNGVDWNTAGIAGVNRPSLSLNFLDYVMGGISSGSVAYAQPMGRHGSVGLSARYFRVGDIPFTTEDNPTGEGLGQFAATDIALKLTLAYRITQDIYIGAAGSLISGSIDEYSAFGVSGDFGLLWKNAYRRLRLAAALRHLGTQTSGYLSEADPLPTQFALGASYPFFREKLLVATDYHWTVDWESSLDAGIEWQAVQDFFVRGGYRSRLSDLRSASDNPGVAGFTFGLGFRKIRSYRIDYGYASLGDLGGTHLFSFTFEFK